MNQKSDQEPQSEAELASHWQPATASESKLWRRSLAPTSGSEFDDAETQSELASQPAPASESKLWRRSRARETTESGSELDEDSESQSEAESEYERQRQSALGSFCPPNPA